MQAHHIPNVMQMAFQAKIGTEMAIFQAVQMIMRRQNGTVVLDLKFAYDTFHMDLLFERCAKVLPDHIPP